MTELVISHRYQPFERSINTGSSPESKRIQKIVGDIILAFRAHSHRERGFDDLYAAYRECCTEDHDGFRGQSVTRQTYDLAFRFLSALPVTLPTPEVSVDPDGEVSFEWIEARDRRVAVSLNEQGRLSYAALYGNGVTTHGTEIFDDSIPETVIQLVKRLGIKG